jgi:hypothetical protein
MKRIKTKVKAQMSKEATFISVCWRELSALFIFTVLLCASAVNIQSQTGGPYDLTRSVIAGGGGSDSAGGTFSLSGTTGQAEAGVNANGGQFNLHNGFWFQNLTPTAAGVTVSGRVTTPDGYGIGGVRIILTGPDGVRHSTITSTFGYYAFSGLTAGFTYILEVSSRRYTFANPTLVVFLNEDLANADFTALP